MARRALLLALGLLAPPAWALEVGAPAPAVQGPGLVDAKPVSLASLRGKVVLLDFWASWCGPCKVSLPEMDRLRAELHAQGHAQRFEVLAVNVDQNPAAALKFLAKHPVSYPLLSDPAGRLPELYGLPTMPSSYLIDATGRVVAVHSGYKPGDAHKKLKPEILALLAKP